MASIIIHMALTLRAAHARGLNGHIREQELAWRVDKKRSNFW